MATITSAELQEAAEAAEDQLAELLEEDQLVDYWQERIDTATALVEEVSGGTAKGKPRTTRATGSAGRAEARNRFQKS